VRLEPVALIVDDDDAAIGFFVDALAGPSSTLTHRSPDG
jgi:hypothetical protein